jgi:hypothetical protein
MFKLTRDDTGNVCTFGKHGASQVITVTITSQQSAAFGAQTTIVRIANAGTSHLHYQVGSNPTASNSTSVQLPINKVEYIEVSGGDKIAVIAPVATIFSVTEIV